jgi:protein arginine kinase activator
MDCDKCGQPAKVHLTQLVGGQVKKIALCNECAGDSGVTDPTGFALADMLLPPDGPEGSPTGVPVGGAPGSAEKCPQCGFSLEDLKKIRRFGCATCYTTFREAVAEMVGSLHQGSTHKGKFPDGLMEKRQREMRLNELGDRLKRAVDTENYEEAAGIRDEIQQLESANEQSGERS